MVDPDYNLSVRCSGTTNYYSHRSHFQNWCGNFLNVPCTFIIDMYVMAILSFLGISLYTIIITYISNKFSFILRFLRSAQGL